MKKKKAKKVILLWILGIFMALAVLLLILQYVVAHRDSPFLPDYPKEELTAMLWENGVLSQDDYRTLFFQTGLGSASIDTLMAQGQHGKEAILDAQAAFFTPPDNDSCTALPPITGEHRFHTADGTLVYGPPLAPLEPGDILLSFSTHSLGWRHGHAGLVIDPENDISLEAIVLGSDSSLCDLNRWRTYSTLLVLRVDGVDMETRNQVAQFALEKLNGIPYSLTSGFFGPKAPSPDLGLTAQCAYLPWYAWQQAGFDLDSDGGALVTVADLALGNQVSVVQLYGINPALFWG